MRKYLKIVLFIFLGFVLLSILSSVFVNTACPSDASYNRYYFEEKELVNFYPDRPSNKEDMKPVATHIRWCSRTFLVGTFKDRYTVLLEGSKNIVNEREFYNYIDDYNDKCTNCLIYYHLGFGSTLADYPTNKEIEFNCLKNDVECINRHISIS